MKRIFTPLLLALTLVASPEVARGAAQSTPQAIALNPEPVSFGELGLTLLFPEGASTQTDTLPGGQIKSIVQPPDGRWVIQVYNTRSTDTQLTAQAALDAILTQRITGGPTGRVNGVTVRLLEATDRINDLIITAPDSDTSVAAARAYLTEREDTKTNTGYPPVGYTVIRTAPGRFVTIQLDTLPDYFDDAKRVYETVVASARIADPDKAARVRAVQLSQGEAFVNSLSRADLDALMDSEPVWIRIYEPASTGSPADARESGYQKLAVKLGQLGELDRTKPSVNWSPEERVVGYLVSLDARVLEEPTSSAPQGKSVPYIDTSARFWLSRDREEEYWTIDLQFRTDEGRRLVSQTLTRRDSRVTVRTSIEGQPAETAEYDILEEHYLSAVERVLLPRLVANRAKDDEGALFNLGFYTYDSSRSAISFRSERFERAPGGGWIQTTVPYKSALPWTTTLDRDGNMITQALPPARTLERTTFEELRSLWTSKGLPTGG